MEGNDQRVCKQVSGHPCGPLGLSPTGNSGRCCRMHTLGLSPPRVWALGSQAHARCWPLVVKTMSPDVSARRVWVGHDGFCHSVQFRVIFLAYVLTVQGTFFFF